MADRLSNLRIVDPVLTTVARGYSNAQFISEAIFPIAQADKEGVVVPLFGKEAFRLYQTERAVRAASNVMRPDTENELDVVLREHDLAYPVDRREKAESMFDAQSRAVKRAKDGLELRREYSAAQLAFNANSYLSGAKVALSGASQWSGNGGDPIAAIEAGKEVVRARIGQRPNTIVMGAATYATLKFHTKLQQAISVDSLKLITVDILKALTGISTIVIGEAIAGDTATGDVWGDSLALVYTAPPADGQANFETPSWGYTIRRSGMPEADTYAGVGGKVEYARYTDIYKQVIVGPDAGYLISDTAA
jgi:hypothetical protein